MANLKLLPGGRGNYKWAKAATAYLFLKFFDAHRFNVSER